MKELLDHAKFTLGITKPQFSSKDICSAFEESKKGEDEKRSKYFLFRYLATEQLQKGDGKLYAFDTPYTPCQDCKGSGEKYVIKMDKMVVNCTICGGTGIKTVPCRECKGSGRDENDKKCTVCKGTGKYVYRKNKIREEDIPCPSCAKYETCSKCNGAKKENGKSCSKCNGKGKTAIGPHGLGHKSVLISSRRIENSYVCGRCKGTGKKREFSTNVGSKLKEAQKESEVMS